MTEYNDVFVQFEMRVENFSAKNDEEARKIVEKKLRSKMREYLKKGYALDCYPYIFCDDGDGEL